MLILAKSASGKELKPSQRARGSRLKPLLYTGISDPRRMMAVERKSRHRGFQLALVVTWLAYAIVLCPNCPGASSRFVRCGLIAAIPAAAAPLPDAGVARDCHRKSGSDDHRHSPGTDCCDSIESRTSTVTARTIVDPPVPTVLPWMYASTPTLLRWNIATRLAPLPPQAHAPPRFLLLRSLLI